MDSIEFAFGQINSLLKIKIIFYAQVVWKKLIRPGKRVRTES
jgi:hypothetical protein